MGAMLRLLFSEASDFHVPHPRTAVALLAPLRLVGPREMLLKISSGL